MAEIVIYVEGGGDSAQQRSELRQGFDSLTRSVALMRAGSPRIGRTSRCAPSPPPSRRASATCQIGGGHPHRQQAEHTAGEQGGAGTNSRPERRAEPHADQAHH